MERLSILQYSMFCSSVSELTDKFIDDKDKLYTAVKYIVIHII